MVKELAELVPMYEELALTAKLHFLQSIVSAILVEMIFRHYFVGLPEHRARQLKDVERYLVHLGRF